MKKYYVMALLFAVILLAVSAADVTTILSLSFDNNNETYTKDDSFYASNGKLSGVMLVKGYNGTAFSFDGSDDYIMEGYNPQFLENLDANFTITAYVYPEKSAENMTIVGYYGAPNARNFQFFVDPQDRLTLLISNGENYELLNSDKLKITRDAWNFVAVTYQRDGNVTLSVDKNAITVSPSIDLVMFLRSLYIGSTCGGMGDPFKGVIDEIKIYDKSLTIEEIQEVD